MLVAAAVDATHGHAGVGRDRRDGLLHMQAISSKRSDPLVASPGRSDGIIKPSMKPWREPGSSISLPEYLAGVGPEPRLRKVLDDDAPLGAAAREEEDSPGPPHVAVFIYGARGELRGLGGQELAR